jgi:CHAT domain-containing protein
MLTPLSQQALGWLYDDLVRPLEPFAEGTRRLLVAPDGVLFQVPFHALYDGQQYLLDRYEIAYVPSATMLLLCQENRSRRAGVHAPPLIVGYSRGKELPYILEEIEAVVATVPGAVILREEEATLARLRESVCRGKLVHLATHATFRHDNPLFSALQLAGGDWLRVMDLYTLHLDGALVTLSGCETGRHTLRGGDLLGLSRGFFCAGASALVVSLWHVGDSSAARLMGHFYAHLADGATAVSALRQAQQDLRDHVESGEEQAGKAVKPYAHPFYWAPFCLLGAPSCTAGENFATEAQRAQRF